MWTVFGGRNLRMSVVDQKKICIIIPCYNESASIPKVIQSLSSVIPEAFYLFINDASSDDSEKVLRNFTLENMTVITLPVNLGIGGAVQAGLLFAVENGFEYAVKFDGDGQHLASEIKDILKPVELNEADLVIGSRFLCAGYGFKSTFMRRLGIRLFRSLSRFLTGHLITDNTSGFRAYSRQALEFAARYYPSFDYPEPEEIILFLKNGYRVKEVPVLMAERSGGKSSINPAKAVYYMIKVTFSVFMAAFRPKIGKEESC